MSVKDFVDGLDGPADSKRSRAYESGRHASHVIREESAAVVNVTVDGNHADVRVGDLSEYLLEHVPKHAYHSSTAWDRGQVWITFRTESPRDPNVECIPQFRIVDDGGSAITKRSIDGANQ